MTITLPDIYWAPIITKLPNQQLALTTVTPPYRVPQRRDEGRQVSDRQEPQCGPGTESGKNNID